MKKILILNGEFTNTENYAIRDVLENFGYIVTIFNIGRPQDYYDILSQRFESLWVHSPTLASDLLA